MLFKQYPMGSDLEKQKVVTKIFNPYGEGRWYLLNSDPEDPDYIWAIVSMFGNVEIGSVSRSELESIRLRPFGLPLERDLYFTPKNAKEVYEGLLSGKFFEEGGRMSQDEYYQTSKEAKSSGFNNPFLGKTLVKTTMDLTEDDIGMDIPAGTEGYIFYVPMDAEDSIGIVIDGNHVYLNQDAVEVVFAKGGKVDILKWQLTPQRDLFEDYENIPPQIQKILDKHEEAFMDGNYEGLAKALKEVEAKGYTFDYYLDGQAYGLRPKGVEINQLIGYEEFAKGGEINESRVNRQLEKLHEKGYLKRYIDTRGTGKKVFETIRKNNDMDNTYSRYESANMHELGIQQNAYMTLEEVKTWINKTMPVKNNN
jgi:predicted transcriptional regulator